MKKYILQIVIVAILGSCVIVNWLNQPSIAYVESSYLMENYDGIKDLKLKLKKESFADEKLIDSLKDEFNTALKRYKVNAKIVSKQSIITKELLRKMELEINYRSEELSRKSQEQYNRYLQGIINQMNTVISNYCKEKGYDIVMGSTEFGSLVYGADKYNISEDILEILNQSYKKE